MAKETIIEQKTDRELTITDFSRLISISSAYVVQQIKCEKYPMGCIIKGVRRTPHKVFLDIPTVYAQWTAAGMRISKTGRARIEEMIKEKGWEIPDVSKIIERLKKAQAAREPKPKIPKEKVEYEGQTDPGESTLDSIEKLKDFGNIPSDTNIYEANRRKEVANAGIAELKYLQLSAMLVNKSDVYKTFFEFGQEMSIKIQQIPERVAPFIRAAISDQIVSHEIIEMIRKEIEDFQLAFTGGPDDQAPKMADDES